ncbi:MAG: AAA-like domain-containing protein [Candidatus Poribacteria bacterium]|nr:AAA-like domain-containing protein [Candidatus Poribacteria bacterium]
MRTFGTQGPVNPKENYVVARTEEIADFVDRVKKGKYIVLFAPRQTGKTTLFRAAINVLIADTYFPIQLNFEVYVDLTPAAFYDYLIKDIRREIEHVFEKRDTTPSETLNQFLDDTEVTDHFSMRNFFQQLPRFLTHPDNGQKAVLIIDEFDAIPPDAVRGFLHSLRYIYLDQSSPRCPYSVGIVGVKNITQLNYDRSISPFNIQDEFHLPNFTQAQVQELLEQYTDEVGQAFAPEVITAIHKQTAGQPFLVNRCAQILTEEMNVPKNETITMAHFSKAHTRLLEEGNTNIRHLLTNIRRDRRFERMLMRIASYERGLRFNPDDEIMDELSMYGVITKGTDGMCEIVNPIYQHRILQAFKPAFNGLEAEYFAEENGDDFIDYLTPDGVIQIEALLNNFQNFIARVGFRILQVPDTPQEYIGQHLLYAYLDHFVHVIGANMFLEVQTGRGRMDLLITYNQHKYIVETKIWEGDRYYQAGKKQLAAYLKLEGEQKGYYVVFDHRNNPTPRVETETVNGLTIRSYIIPVVQEQPSSAGLTQFESK